MKPTILLIILLVLISACSQVEPEINEEPVVAAAEEEHVQEEVVETVNETIEEQEPVITCEEWAESLFPMQWVFNQEVTDDPGLTKEILGLREGTWKDDFMIKGTSSTKIEMGSKTGENINYYYTRPIFPGMKEDNYGFIYSKKIIDVQGNVLGENTFHIRPVFRIIYDTVKDEKNKWGDPIKVRYLSLVIVEPNFISCEKVD
ncbi:hypothetical protein KY348_07795 [Candidatus Woesearchaeota archaeon]|nr:hypothetical protein [Candidatus Woesearchaeota archaeon]